MKFDEGIIFECQIVVSPPPVHREYVAMSYVFHHHKVVGQMVFEDRCDLL